MSVLVGKLTTLIYGDFYCQVQNESKQKRPPWQEVVFRVDENCGRLSPQGGDLVQIHSSVIRVNSNHLSVIHLQIIKISLHYSAVVSNLLPVYSSKSLDFTGDTFRILKRKVNSGFLTAFHLRPPAPVDRRRNLRCPRHGQITRNIPLRAEELRLQSGQAPVRPFPV